MDLSVETLQNIQAASRRAATISALGAVIIFGTLGYSALQLRKLQAQTLTLEHNLIETRHQLEEAQGQLREKQRELEAIRNELRNAPSSNDAVRKGVAHYYEGKLTEAIAAYNEALRLDPYNSMAYGLRGQALLKDGNPQQAILSLRKSIDIQPDNFQAHYSLSLAYWKTGSESDAVNEVKVLLRLNPDEYPLIRWDGNFANFYQSDEYRALLEVALQRVMFVQKALKKLGYYNGPAEGIPGPGTRSAILRYQRDHSLPLTGTWSEDLLQALKNVVSEDRPSSLSH